LIGSHQEMRGIFRWRQARRLSYVAGRAAHPMWTAWFRLKRRRDWNAELRFGSMGRGSRPSRLGNRRSGPQRRAHHGRGLVGGENHLPPESARPETAARSRHRWRLESRGRIAAWRVRQCLPYGIVFGCGLAALCLCVEKFRVHPCPSVVNIGACRFPNWLSPRR